ncbi:hypothetical protein AB0O07_24030 [Streptomyces sp. NPDC093085]|uniref:hypothetical protein n=1 Tax=Streptomyces sp. NPDC093085 TaxID=3155068 RepID=UPI0034188C41
MTARQANGTQAPTAYDRRMHAIMNREEGRSLYGTAARRRLVVGVHIALTAVGVGAALFALATDRVWPLFVMAGALLPWCLATGLLNGATRGLLELRGRILDERQRAERDQAGARAHRVMLTLLLGGTLIALGLGLGPGGGSDLTVPLPYVLTLALITHWLMPLWVAGLRVQDEPADA